jgi:hypothetical protein
MSSQTDDYFIIKTSLWVTGESVRESVWTGYETFPLWLKETIENDIRMCQNGEHTWIWHDETTDGKLEYICISSGCKAVSVK